MCGIRQGSRLSRDSLHRLQQPRSASLGGHRVHAQVDGQLDDVARKGDVNVEGTNLKDVAGSERSVLDDGAVENRPVSLRKVRDPVVARDLADSQMGSRYRRMIEGHVVREKAPDRDAVVFDDSWLDLEITPDDDELGRRHCAGLPHGKVDHLDDVNDHERQHQRRGQDVRRQPHLE